MIRLWRFEARVAAVAGFTAVLALVIWWVPVGVTTTTDATSNDLLDGLRILRGEMIERFWRPFQYLLVAVFIKLFGVSVEATLYATRVFWAAGILLVYGIGARCFGVATGLAAAALALTSFAVNHSASLASPVDTLAPLMALTVVWLTFEAHRRVTTLVAILGGVVLAAACLTKEVLLPFAALPLLATLLSREVPRETRWRLVRTIYTAFLVAYLPWILIVGTATGQFSSFLGDAAPWSQEHYLGYARGQASPLTTALTTNIHNSAIEYYRVYLARFFPIAPVLAAVPALMIGWAAWTRRSGPVLLALGIVLYAPSVLVQAVVGERLAHGLTMFLVLYIALAALLTALPRELLPGRARLQRTATIGGVAIAAWLSVVQWTAAPNPTRDLLFPPASEQPVGRLTLWRPSELVIRGRMDPHVEAAAEWLRSHSAPDEAVLVDGGSYTAMQVLTRLEHTIVPLPTIVSTDDLRERPTDGSAGPLGRPLLAAPSAKFLDGDVRRYRVLFIAFENEVLDAIRSAGTRRLMLGPQRYYMSLYFDAVPWARRVFSSGDAAIYEIHPEMVAPIDVWEFVSANTTPAILTRFASNHPDEYRDTIALLEGVGVTTDMLAATYDLRQQEWFRRHLEPGPGRRIMYSSPHGQFAIPEWEQQVSWFNQDRSLASLEGYDYLVLHSMRRATNEYPQLCADLKDIAPIKIFPNLTELDFGSGWEIYRLPKP